MRRPVCFHATGRRAEFTAYGPNMPVHTATVPCLAIVLDIQAHALEEHCYMVLPSLADCTKPLMQPQSIEARVHVPRRFPAAPETGAVWEG